MALIVRRHLTPMLCGNRIIVFINYFLDFQNDASDNFSGAIFISFLS